MFVYLQEKAEAARDQIKAAVPDCRGPEVAIMDLSDLDSVRAWASRAQDFGLPLDLVVANAGVMACPEMKTKQGYEYQFGVNHLGHFLLINMLTPLLKASEESTGNPARVVHVSSTAHLFGGPSLNLQDLNFEKRKYNAWQAYGQSKLANILFAFELARRAPYISSNALHPGVVNTELGRFLLPEGGLASASWWQRPIYEFIQSLALSPEEGARTSIYLASSPEVEGVTGKYFDACREVQSSAVSRDPMIAKRLWDLSAEMVDLDIDRDIGADIGKQLFSVV